MAARKPTNVLQLAGAFKHDPKRGEARANEPKPAEPLRLDAPAGLTQLQAMSWRELRKCVHEGSCSANDEPALLVAAKLYCRIVYETEDAFSTKDVTAFFSILTKFGMTPADRSRVSVEKAPPAASPYAKFKVPAAR